MREGTQGKQGTRDDEGGSRQRTTGSKKQAAKTGSMEAFVPSGRLSNSTKSGRLKANREPARPTRGKALLTMPAAGCGRWGTSGAARARRRSSARGTRGGSCAALARHPAAATPLHHAEEERQGRGQSMNEQLRAETAFSIDGQPASFQACSPACRPPLFDISLVHGSGMPRPFILTQANAAGCDAQRPCPCRRLARAQPPARNAAQHRLRTGRVVRFAFQLVQIRRKRRD